MEFYRHVNQLNSNLTAKLLDYSFKESYIFMTFLYGNLIRSFNYNNIFKFSQFIKNINTSKKNYKYNAIDCCLSLNDHIKLINKKFNLFKQPRENDQKLDNFFTNYLIPTKKNNF